MDPDTSLEKSEFRTTPQSTILLAALLLTSSLAAQPGDRQTDTRRIEFQGAVWEARGEVEVTRFKDRPALSFRGGQATLVDAELEDGTIELDMAVAGHPSFAFLQFRVRDDQEYEELYFRPHKSLSPDAVQYTPVHFRRSAWQLYHGKESTAAAALAADEWVHVRLGVQGSRAALYLGDADEPVLLPELKRAPAAGSFALRARFPRGATTEGPVVRFANVKIRPGVLPAGFGAEAPATEPEAGVVASWSISESFVPPSGPLREVPGTILDSPGWRKVTAEPSGLVDLGAVLDRPEGARRWSTLARVKIESDSEQTRRLDLGFSDEASVFLNGRLLYSANHAWSFNFPRRQGLINLDQASVYLPLRRGENDLVVAVTEVFGGWGLMARLEERAGVEVSPGS